MSAVYFWGLDVYKCLPFDSGTESDSVIGLANEPKRLANIVNIEYGHFYAVYQKLSLSWYISAVGLSETEIFSSDFCIKEVAVSKNLIIGLSEDKKLFKLVIDIDTDSDELCLKFSKVEHVTELDGKLLKITSNDFDVFGLNSSPEISKIFRINEKDVTCVAEVAKTCLIDLAVGHGHFVAMSNTGAVWNWGHCGRSELAGCNEVSKMSACEKPKRIEFFDDLPCVVSKIACGGWHTLALTSDGDIYSFGWNESGQLGHDSTISSKSCPYPIDLGSAENPVIDIASGSRHSLALLKSGCVYSWGRNQEGQARCESENLNTIYKPQKINKVWPGSTTKVRCGKWASFAFTRI